jgi:hypothetical protein
MDILTKKINDCIKATQLCYVATINDNNTPNLSPKGSLAVFDDHHLVFANISSSRTIANLRKRPCIELNIIDIFKRKGYRITGTGEIMEKGTKEYDFVSKPLWKKHGDKLPVHNVVKIRIRKIREIFSPAYQHLENCNENSLSIDFLKTYTERVNIENNQIIKK